MATSEVDQQIAGLAESVSQSLSAEGAETFADSEIQSMIQSHVQNMVAEQMSEETQKTNLEEENLVEVEQTVSNEVIMMIEESFLISAVFPIINYIKRKNGQIFIEFN